MAAIIRLLAIAPALWSAFAFAQAEHQTLKSWTALPRPLASAALRGDPEVNAVADDTRRLRTNATGKEKGLSCIELVLRFSHLQMSAGAASNVS
jgi:hypothetical protein